MKTKVKSKTLWVNSLIVIAGAIGGASGTDVIQNNPELAGYFVAIMGVVNILLRFVTKEPVQ